MATSRKTAAKKTAAKKATPTKTTTATKKKTDKPEKFISQFAAVKKKAEVEMGGFKFEAVPPGVNKELIADNSYKRFHGSRMLFSWFPQEFIDNNKDRFGYMFPDLQTAGNRIPYTPANKTLLEKLGDEIGKKESSGGTLPPVTDATIPAGFTYLGQFVDHDITLDVNSDISKDQNANDIPNMRSPSLDLDAVYGQGPGVNPFLYNHDPALGKAQGVKLMLGTNRDTGNGGPSLATGNNNFGNPATIAGGNNFDVQRTADFTAIIGDPRNDENLIVSQLHHAFIKFHNKVTDNINTSTFTGDLFTEAKKLVTHHYQWVVIHDFLKKVCDPAIVDKTLNNGPKFFKKKPFVMPVEFSVAAYRFGHSLIRNDYFMNAPLTGQLSRAATLIEVFEFIRVGRLPVFSNWVIDFNLFFDGRPVPTVNGVKKNFTRKIDTRLAPGLSELPNETGNIMPFLAKRNLVRGMALRVPTGQAVAKAIRAKVLTDQQLQNNNTTQENKILNEQNGLLLKKTPLWYYILKEAEEMGGNRLGEVGSTIVAEVFIRILREDANSFVNATPKFKPGLPRFNNRPVGDYDMSDILNFAGVLTLG